MDTDTLIEFAMDVDLSLEPACEHSAHEREHNPESAAYRIQYHHVDCGRRKVYLICQDGLNRFVSNWVLCPTCNTLHEMNEVITVLEKL